MKGKIGFERRRVERFLLKATAVVQVGSPGAEKVFKLTTQDISSGGAFFPMELPLPTGEKLKITLYLSVSRQEGIPDLPRKAKVSTTGHVVRSTAQGIGVAFDRRYSISPD